MGDNEQQNIFSTIYISSAKFIFMWPFYLLKVSSIYIHVCLWIYLYITFYAYLYMYRRYICIYIKYFIHLFMRERERGRDIGRGRSRLHVESPTWDLMPGLQDQALG